MNIYAEAVRRTLLSIERMASKAYVKPPTQYGRELAYKMTPSEKEKRKPRDKAYRESHREKRREYNRQYNRQYRLAHLEYYREYSRNYKTKKKEVA